MEGSADLDTIGSESTQHNAFFAGKSSRDGQRERPTVVKLGHKRRKERSRPLRRCRKGVPLDLAMHSKNQAGTEAVARFGVLLLLFCRHMPLPRPQDQGKGASSVVAEKYARALQQDSASAPAIAATCSQQKKIVFLQQAVALEGLLPIQQGSTA